MEAAEQHQGDDRPFSHDFWHLGEDIDILAAYSLTLRAQLVMLRRNRWRGHIRPAHRTRLASLCDSLRLQLRVKVDWHPAVRPPRYEKDALDFMRAPHYLRTRDFAQLQMHADRGEADPRVIETVERLIRDARKLEIPLWPTAWDNPKAQRQQQYVMGFADEPPGPSVFDTGTAVEIGHCSERFLPWLCWDVIDGLAGEAGNATGYRLRRIDLAPGRYALAVDAPEWRAPPGLQPKRLTVKQAAEERARVEAAHGVKDWDEATQAWVARPNHGAWVDEHGEVHESGFGPDPRLVDRYGKTHATEAEAEAADAEWSAPKPERVP